MITQSFNNSSLLTRTGAHPFVFKQNVCCHGEKVGEEDASLHAEQSMKSMSALTGLK